MLLEAILRNSPLTDPYNNVFEIGLNTLLKKVKEADK
jgi:hypothetical protein